MPSNRLLKRVSQQRDLGVSEKHIQTSIDCPKNSNSDFLAKLLTKLA
jgi:hypothetical protein